MHYPAGAPYSHTERYLERSFHSRRFDGRTKRVVCPSMPIIYLMSSQLMICRGMIHDPNIFPEPDRCYPERWLFTGVPEF
jgi:hypothetical protein